MPRTWLSDSSLQRWDIPDKEAHQRMCCWLGQPHAGTPTL